MHNCNIIKYADDTVLYVNGKDSETIQEKLNTDIPAIYNWLTNNDLSLNLKKGKTETMIFGTSARVKKATPLNVLINGTILNQTTSYKYLGVHLDPTLTLNDDFDSKYKKLSSRLRLLSKVRPNLTIDAAKLIYLSIIVPVFTYCGTVNLNLSRTSLTKLEKIHERAFKIIKGNSDQQINVTPLMTLIKRHACQIVRKSITTKLPSPMDNYFELMTHSKTTRNNKNSIVIPKVKTKTAQNGFFYQGATIYNSLTREIRSEVNQNIFLNKLKNFNF